MQLTFLITYELYIVPSLIVLTCLSISFTILGAAIDQSLGLATKVFYPFYSSCFGTYACVTVASLKSTDRSTPLYCYITTTEIRQKLRESPGKVILLSPAGHLHSRPLQEGDKLENSGHVGQTSGTLSKRIF